MAGGKAQSNRAPVIIKRKKVVGGGGHHGGAWKVAYADFVTAMMAFFLLMWLLNATTEQQRKGLADYFSPTLPINRMSAGGEGAFGGDSMFTDETLAHNGSGASSRAGGSPGALNLIEGTQGLSRDAAEVAALEDVADSLVGRGGESLLSDQALRHVVTRLTDEGLIIEVYARAGAPIFVPETDTPLPVTEEIVAVLARISGLVENDVAVAGHTRARPRVEAVNPVWALSTDRAQRVRTLLEAGGLSADRLRRVTGHADRVPAARDPMSVRNDRFEVALLRSDL